MSLPGVGWDLGVPLGYIRELADYGRTSYDWREHESRLNEHSQFITNIDGQVVHFLHVRSPEPDAVPLIITHGWPSSVVEFTEIVGPLVDPRAHGADPAHASTWWRRRSRASGSPGQLVTPDGTCTGSRPRSPHSCSGWDTTATARTAATSAR